MAEQRPYVYEPEANGVGVLTRGRNATWRPKRWQPLHPSYVEMFGTTELFKRLHKAGSRGRNMSYRIMIVDVGSFTTDIALVAFEMVDGIDNFERPRIDQVSEPLGVRQLDEAIISRLPTDTRMAIEAQRVGERERGKRLLIEGRGWAVPKPGGGNIIVGDS